MLQNLQHMPHISKYAIIHVIGGWYTQLNQLEYHLILHLITIKSNTCLNKDWKQFNVVSNFFPHDDVIKWKHFPRYWTFVRRIHRSPVNSPHKGQWRGALMFTLVWAWINGKVNNRGAGDLRRHHAHYDVNVMGLYSLDIPVMNLGC